VGLILTLLMDRVFVMLVEGGLNGNLQSYILAH
jgi:hypothetical protein